ncbi:MAG: hypothetical protein L0271_26500 [Gemmatimonadetes bacterium]|nr:hypothetical protein [Gemmatimonadota bacterium]
MSQQQATQYRMIRFALFAGVIVFGGVAWYVSAGNAADDGTAAIYRTLGLVFMAVTVMALSGLPVLRKGMERAATPDQRAGLMIAGWALGEGVALFGAVILLMTGRPLLFIVGAGLLIVAFAAFPIPEDG